MARARIPAQEIKANLEDYELTYADFSWEDVQAEFSWQHSGQLNLAHEAMDRWAADPERADHPALVILDSAERHSFTYRQLSQESRRLGNLLKEHGLKPGDRLALFMPPLAEMFLALIACARIGVAFCCLPPGLESNRLAYLLEDLDPQAILSHPELAQRLPGGSRLAGIKMLWAGPPPAPDGLAGVSLPEDLPRQPAACETAWLAPEHPLYIVYTSGNTGPPKGVVHGHGDMAGQMISARYALDLKDHSRLWCDYPPWGVATTVYGAFAPWLCGATSLVQTAPFEAATWYQTLEREKVTTYYTSPATLKRLRAAGDQLPQRYDFSRLEHISTVGEPLSQELFFWTRNNLQKPPHDTWWMAETGIITLANFPSLDIKLGSCGRLLPGIEAAVIDASGRPQTLLTLGQLALKPAWPGLLSGLWRDEERFGQYFHETGWFLTGDLALIDEDGYFYVQGRADDLLRLQDRMLGPYEVESLLGAHPEVAQAAVVALPGPKQSPVFKAYVVPADAVSPTAELRGLLLSETRARLGDMVPLVDLEFLDELPRSASGRLIRRGLRALGLGLPLGDCRNLADD